MKATASPTFDVSGPRLYQEEAADIGEGVRAGEGDGPGAAHRDGEGEMVLEVAADAGRRDADVDPGLGELLGVTDARLLEQLR